MKDQSKSQEEEYDSGMRHGLDGDSGGRMPS